MFGIKKKIYCVIAVLFISLYIFASYKWWFAELYKKVDVARNPVFSSAVDLSKKGKFIWKIPRDKWNYRDGEARLALVFNHSSLDAAVLDRERRKLRANVDVYAIPDGREETKSRLINNWYYTTNETSLQNTRLWNSGGEGIEFGLAGFNVYPHEDIFVTLDVTVPNSSLNFAGPRLKVVGAYDVTIFEVLPLIRIIRVGGLIVSLLLLFGLAIIVWRDNSSKPVK